MADSSDLAGGLIFLIPYLSFFHLDLYSIRRGLASRARSMDTIRGDAKPAPITMMILWIWGSSLGSEADGWLKRLVGFFFYFLAVYILAPCTRLSLLSSHTCVSRREKAGAPGGERAGWRTRLLLIHVLDFLSSLLFIFFDKFDNVFDR